VNFVAVDADAIALILLHTLTGGSPAAEFDWNYGKYFGIKGLRFHNPEQLTRRAVSPAIC
jgi:hypothetical protein